METWDIYTRGGQKTGRTIERGQKLEPGDYHLVVHIWPYDENGKYLIQKRAPHIVMGGLWDGTGGSALQGEDSITAALRETREELGITLQPDTITMVKRYVTGDHFSDIYKAPLSPAVVEQATLGKEVEAVKWVDRPEVDAMVRQGSFYDYDKHYKGYLDLIFRAERED